MPKPIAPLDPGYSSTRSTRLRYISRMFLIELLLGIATLLLDIASILLADEEAHRRQHMARTEPPDAPSIDTTTENLQENVGVIEAETPGNEIWIMEYPTYQSLYSSSNTLSDDSTSEESEEEVIPTLEALWADWNPEPDQIDYPDRPTTPGILETTLANDTGNFWPVSETNGESNQPEPHRSNTPDSIECIFNPTGRLEMSDIEW
ncbi:hypothetical protein H112_07121 [Trichophyton rubrum D6]|uniref:Uncharacterized protein n=3 Tax=Trichophyton rubrum TaxID=5551 RepID=A0A178F282_TRIRU|nr:uncharacterized protein TERG_02453 [Trichophyton rubrum CBS 118892]EZF11913.1 hypothetical protein H100_07143 [Trichophyton rubrum MR850]EZF38706.1 hypothetical protein H102_07106 [Trichophyton rubrum CBS 100081]EZF49330.1 hypothetical protein H103_07127 [Trichophyton rubrum CBS 288.86]EZF60052.1 hypothetical protein H104_07083 [Trichophyton rubrum CBS 289.86]EZF81265.1 hypothetical protein H110_07127 [Trichophyton rubrum MR1448]EZF92005.1 hypothetical protein H113_07178 [Trichophyton rubr